MRPTRDMSLAPEDGVLKGDYFPIISFSDSSISLFLSPLRGVVAKHQSVLREIKIIWSNRQADLP